MTLVSVICPTYNRPQLLTERCLPSILRQSHRDLDVHVVGDGTDDLTCQLMAAHPDPRLRFTNRPHQDYPTDPGTRWSVLAMDVLNYGLDTALGEWVAVLADDDAWELDMIETLLEAAERQNVDFAYGISQYHWPDGHPQTAGRWPPGYGSFCDGAYVRRANSYRYDPDCVLRGLPEDGDLWNRMYAAGVTFTFVQKLVHHYWPAQR